MQRNKALISGCNGMSAKCRALYCGGTEAEWGGYAGGNIVLSAPDRYDYF